MVLSVCAVDHRLIDNEEFMISINKVQSRSLTPILEQSMYIGIPDPEPTKALIPTRDAQHPDRLRALVFSYYSIYHIYTLLLYFVIGLVPTGEMH